MPPLPSPFGDCVGMRKKGVIPAEAGIQVFEFVITANSLNAACAGMTNYDPAS